MTNIHLLVLIHGMWGNPTHLAYMDKIIREVKGSTENSDGPELAVLVAKTNRDESTYDGIDWGGERVAQEVLEEIKEYENQGKTVTRFSITGYSLGGLLARYVIGILHQNKFFENVAPVNFNTIATPHIGIPRFPSTFSAIFFCVDKWSPRGRPLLDVLADPDHIFYQALLLFPNIRIYANAVNDLTVPYVTAAIEETDFFAEYEKNGLEIEFHDEYKHVVKSYTLPSSPPPPREEKKTSYFTRIQTSRPLLPGGFPLNLLVYALLPILIPPLLSLTLIRLSISSRCSRTRIKALEINGSNKQRLARVIANLESDVESAVLDMYDNSQGPPSSPSSPPRKDPTDGALIPQDAVDISVDSTSSPSQALLSPIQLRCIENLNKIPQLQKERAFFKGVRNAHAIIVCRDVKNFKFHLEGEGVLRHWADHFEL